VIENDPVDLEVEVVDGELRFTNIGYTHLGRFLVVVTTMRQSCLRVVTGFPALRRLVQLYLSLRGV
jgi:uncharacterized DUF497 family protein